MAPFNIGSAVTQITVRGGPAIPLNYTYVDFPPTEEPSLDLGTGSTAFFLVIIWAVVVTSFGLAYLFRKCHIRWIRAWRLDNDVHMEWYREPRANRMRRRIVRAQRLRDRPNDIRWGPNRHWRTIWSQEVPGGERAWESEPRTMGLNGEMVTFDGLAR